MVFASPRLARLCGVALGALALAAAPRALACVPGCSGYHLIFTGPTGPGGSGLASADRTLTVTWQDSVDGPSATFDILASPEPVPAYPMHSFPAELPGEVLALGLSATARSDWTWDTSQLAPGTYFLYAVFHNSPFNTLVMPFAVVSVSHGAAAAVPVPAIIVRSPRGASAASGAITVAFDAAPGTSGASVDLYVGSPPDAADATLIASGLSTAVGQSVPWESSGASNGNYVFKAVLRDASGNALASALSPGTVEVGAVNAAGGSCATGAGPFAPLSLLLLAALRWRRRPAL